MSATVDGSRKVLCHNHFGIVVRTGSRPGDVRGGVRLQSRVWEALESLVSRVT